MFHVGGARSALQNWLYAEQPGGAFVLRIEDTDAARNRPEWTEGIISALDWIGIERRHRYEGPYFQSAYAGAAPRAPPPGCYAAGRAYYCDCTRERGPGAAPATEHTGLRRLLPRPRPRPGRGRALRFRTPDEGATWSST